MEIFHTLNLNNQVISLDHIGHGNLTVSDGKGILHLLKEKWDKNVLSFTTSMSVNIPMINNDTLSSMVSMSANQALFAVYDGKKKIVKVFDLKNKKIFFEISWHQGIVDLVQFDRNNKYLATGGNDGKVCLWSCSTGRLVYSLPQHLDYVSSLEFHTNNRRFASASYDATINIIDLRNMELVSKLKGRHKTAIKHMKFFSMNMIISIDRLGSIYIWDYKKTMFEYSLPKIKSDPIFMTVVEDEYVIIAGSDSYIYLFSLSKRKLLNMRYIYVQDGISAVTFNSSNYILFIATLKNSITCYDLREGKDDIQVHVTSENYKEAYLLLAKNPLLEHLEPYVQILYEIWDDTIKEAIEQLEEDHMEDVKRIFEPFMAIAVKSKFINSLILDYRDFKQFRTAIDNKKFNLANTLLIKHPSYKESSSYKIMQDDWDICVKKAEAALSDNTDDIDKELNDIFQNFRGISDKLFIIREIGSKRVVLSLFNKNYKKENFGECYKLIDDYPFLAEVENYRNLIFKEKIFYENMKKKLRQGDYEGVKSQAKVLLSFPSYRSEANSMLMNISKIDIFKEHYEKKNYRSMMSLTSKYSFLKDLPEMKKFNDKFDRNMEISETYSSKGNIAQILKIFEPYIFIIQLQERMSKILSSAYVTQLTFLVNKYPDRTKTVIDGINNYMFIFGVDDAILAYVDFIKHNLGFNIVRDEFDSAQYKPDHTKWVKANLPARIF